MTDQPLDLDAIEARIDAYRKHRDLGFACCSAHPVANAVPAMAAEIRRLRAEREEARKELAAAARVSEALYRRLSEEQLAGSALYAALTMPTTPEQRQAALDRFTAVAQQASDAATQPAARP